MSTDYTHFTKLSFDQLFARGAGDTPVINSLGVFVGSVSISGAISVKSIACASNAVFVGTIGASNFSGSHSGTSSGTNTGDQTITLTGNVTGSGTGSFSTTIVNSAVTNVMVAATANISGSKIASASSSAAGVVSTGTQSFAGTKTFVTALAGSNVASASSSASGVVTTGSQSFAGTKTFVTPLAGSSVASASSSASGVVTTGTQSFAGTKTFVTALAGSNVASASSSASGVVSTGAQSFAGAKTFKSTIAASNLTGTNTGDLTYWSGSTKAGSVWTTTSTSYVNGTNSGGNSLVTKVSSGITVSAAGSSAAGITWTPAANTSVYLITATFAQFNSGANNNSFRLTDGTNVISTASGFGTSISYVTVSGIYAPATASAVTVKLQMATSAGTLHLDSEGVSALLTPTIEWTLVKIL